MSVYIQKGESCLRAEMWKDLFECPSEEGWEANNISSKPHFTSPAGILASQSIVLRHTTYDEKDPRCKTCVVEHDGTAVAVALDIWPSVYFYAVG